MVYRRDDFVICGGKVGDHSQPTIVLDLPIDFTPPDRFDELLKWSPYLSLDDIKHFRTRGASSVAVRDGERVAAMNFFVPGPGSVWVDELKTEVPLTEGDHFSCRTYVSPEYRGRAMFEHMIWWYSQRVPPDGRIWGLVLEENDASLRSLARNGWKDFGRWSAVTRFGRRTVRHTEHAPKPLSP